MEAIAKSLRRFGSATISGLQGSAGAYILSRLLPAIPGAWAVVVGDAQRAEAFAKDLALYAPEGPEIQVLPSWEVLPFDQASPYIRLQCQRIQILRRLAMGSSPGVIVIPLGAWMMRLPPREWLKQGYLDLMEGLEIPMDHVVGFLEGRGYKRVPLVEEPGDYGIRGGILDCFSPNEETPIRIEFFGDEIASIRTFSPDTQRSLKRMEAAEILPVREIPWSPEERGRALGRLERRIQDPADRGLTHVLENLSDGMPSPGVEFLLPLFHETLDTMMDFLPEQCTVVLEEPETLDGRWRTLWEQAGERSHMEEFPLARLVSPRELYLAPEDILAGLGSRRHLTIEGIHWHAPGEETARVFEIPTASHTGLRAELSRSPRDEEALGGLARRFGRWLEEGLSVHWFVSSATQAVRLRDHLGSTGIPCRLDYPQEGGPGTRARVWLRVGELSQGFFSSHLGVVFLTEEEVFGPRRLQRPRRARRKPPTVTHLEDLRQGDLVVHLDHGIGIYRGLKTLEVGGLRGDFLHLEYLGNDRLYVPVDRFQIVHKYMGTEGALPRIDRLGGTLWEQRKKRVKQAVARMAKELLQLYAAREVAEGHPFSTPDELYREFEEVFPYDETPDQQRAIEEVMEDMSLARPMDRLVCGDVGFGKTEVAMRAAFRAVMDGKQVAYLVPTTILAEQHYQTFLERFRGYPVFIEVLSRFRTPTQQREILGRCRDGTVDVLIGTHRLIQKDVAFKELGLLIIDEEHRFGVAHKERLKGMKREVDVLTLTATPIPRTLHMGMVGIRDMSIIETPPPERLSIRTFVASFERALVWEAVQREMARGGQVFFVHNRVQGIERIAGRLREWLPKVSIGIAHGQMPEKQLADVMERFHRKEIDLLVCTTIIQSGLDIPTANTILIHNAHGLGLAEMYQIRGRVGRAGHQAYAYLLVPGGSEHLTRDAVQRLRTLQEFSELGAGFRIATRDLEIRGAGTLLGPSQSGHIDAVGFELYTQLMRRAIAELKGEPLPSEIEPEIDLPIHAYLPEAYIPDAHQRLALYRRLSRIETEGEVLPLHEEMEDRFGPMPEEGENLLHLMGLRCLLKALAIKAFRLRDGCLQMTFHPSTPVSPHALIQMVQGSADPQFRFVSEDTLEVPMDLYGEGPVPLMAKRALKDLLGGVRRSPSDMDWGVETSEF